MKTPLLSGLLLLLLFGACQEPSSSTTSHIDQMPWASLVQQSQGQSVRMMMWQGDPLINQYMQSYVKPELKKRFGIELLLSSGQGNQLVQLLLSELEAGKAQSALDLVWINGETFYQLRQLDALYGPFLEKLPNIQYIDLENPFIGKDFQQPINGYECPWGNVQMCLIYDSTRVQQPPQNRAELLDWAKQHPGRFSIDNHFTGLTFLKVLLMDIAGGPEVLSGAFEEEKYTKYSAQLWAYLDELRPYLWREGAVFPENVAAMHQLFANGELWFSMSNNDAEVDNKVAQGVFPATARAYVMDIGSIQNSHYLGIPKHSGHKAAALVVCNFLLSPEAQYRKQQPAVWGDGTVLDLERLPAEWQQRFAAIPARVHAPPRKKIQERALPELAPEYMLRLAEDFRQWR